ncbi:FUSC family protein [Pseudomonas tolaasii]|uniref:FUSC family protein n=2 Tax=Pseudomonas tolaasii TaxID=29442 RepID=A0A7Y8AT78_PSETO|nr:FUSC family protein [Pseudomonas tolaasii]ARB27388.1 fusaric acid resistance protein [Pseudomonas tolaasii]KAB0467505.1 FUSC family protein [Pseudomonas tolaasii]MBY8943284.1 FUSC family protein [Pseudomonas tolaasii]NWC21808.1 FUSC family protein [Pseudomonas tolaasii]NWD39866.1 FUSC family protein [Pseudomonas tolaasii]
MAGLVWRVLAVLPRPWTAGTQGYVFRSMAAATLALWLGFALHLDSPFSAASTVLLLIHPLQGAVIGKGLNRALGTALGLLAATVLLSLFAQKMLLFILGIGLWLGLCVAGMTLFRHYNATAAVVAGYTVCLALGPAIVAPQQGFDHLVTRGTAVVLGVVSLSLVATLLGRKTVEPQLRQMLRDVSLRTMRLLALQFQGAASAVEHTQLALDINKVDDLLGIGRGESSLIRTRLATLQAGLAYLHGVVLQTPAAHGAASVRTGVALQQLAEEHLDFSTAAARIEALQASLSDEPERLSDPLADLSNALRSFACLDRATPAAARAVGFHRHYGDALFNGIRALVATLATGAVWYLTGWDQGPTLLAVLGPYCTLLATSAAPTQHIAGLFRGTLYGVLAAGACKFLLLPHISGFGLLALLLSAFWVFGIQATTRPSHALPAIAYLISFNTLVSTGATAQYDFIDFANQALAWQVALAICLLAFQILPRNSAGYVTAMRRALHAQTRLLLRDGSHMDLLKWQAKQQHRLVTLQALPGAGNPPADAAGYVSLQLSRSLARLYDKACHLEAGSPTARCTKRGIRRLARYASHPAINAVHARRTAHALGLVGAGGLADCFLDIADLLAHYASATTAEVN